MDRQRISVIANLWREPYSELAYVTRSIAAAASRWATVSIHVPGLSSSEPDGAFDLHGAERGDGSDWLRRLSPDVMVIVDTMTPEVSALLSKRAPRAVFSLSALPPGLDPSWRRLSVVPDETAGPSVSLYVPINRGAEQHRHNGFGFTGYLLVLSGRSGDHDAPPTEAAWLVAACHDADVIVIEDGVASAWRGRALRGSVPVDSRMDLWRLIAHANACIDLAPGRHVARECVEALRFGTPIIVPHGSGPATLHASRGGGITFRDPEELLEGAESLADRDARSSVSRRGQLYADGTYGDPSSFVERLRAAVVGTTP